MSECVNILHTEQQQNLFSSGMQRIWKPLSRWGKMTGEGRFSVSLVILVHDHPTLSQRKGSSGKWGFWKENH